MFKRILNATKPKSPPSSISPSIATHSVTAVNGEADFETLSPLIYQSTQNRRLETILYSRNQPGAASAEKGQIGLSVWGKDQDPTARSWKACTGDNKKNVVGISTISYHSGEIGEYVRPDKVSYRSKPETLRVEFLFWVNGEYNRLRRKWVDGLEHVCWEGLYTLQSPQSQAVSDDLIRWGFQHFNLMRETIIVFTENPEPFTRLGWEQVDLLEVDPRPWVGSEEKETAFGVCVLLRRPGELKAVEVEGGGEK